MNGHRLKKQSIYSYEKFKSICSKKSIYILEQLILPNLYLYSFNHIDMHNIGHFLGNWPYDRSTKDIALGLLKR